MILDDIVAKKREYLKNTKHIDFIEDNFSSIASFYEALAKPGLSIIGEIKKASPSKGLIKPNFEPIQLAKQYEYAVDAISVLTEEHYFLGSPKYLKDIHTQVKLPLLRKDFIIDSYQILEARALGASAVLLIVAILDKKQLKDFLNISKKLGLDTLVEVHNEQEIDIALSSGAKIIGINNRDLKTFDVKLDTTTRLRKLIPNDIIVVGESGINTKKDINVMKQANVNAILVGESFMKTDDIKKKSDEFRKSY